MLLLSVHLITFNNEKHIEETIQSILKQEVDFEYEIVVGDDCSTDKTIAIIKKYAEKHPGLFKIHKNETRLGILKNFKTTLDKCNGEYVFDIAGDDFLKSEITLQKMINAFKKHPEIGFIDCGFDRLDDRTNKITGFTNNGVITASKEKYKEALILGKIAPIGHCFNKKKLYQFVDFDSYLEMDISIEDYPILVDMIMNTDFKQLNDSLVVYRAHDQSYSHKKDLREMLDQKEEMRFLFDHFSNKYKFSEDITTKYYKAHYKHLLFFAGYFRDKELGKKAFNKVRSKSPKDYIHFWTSQNKWLRKIISLRKKFF